jgi:hypothetical protein
MTHNQAKQSHWMLALLFCFSFQAFVPAGYMLGSTSEGLITLCTGDGLSQVLASAFSDEPVEQGHDLSAEPCVQSASAEPASLNSLTIAQHAQAHTRYAQRIVRSHQQSLSPRYHSRAPPRLV